MESNSAWQVMVGGRSFKHMGHIDLLFVLACIVQDRSMVVQSWVQLSAVPAFEMLNIICACYQRAGAAQPL